MELRVDKGDVMIFDHESGLFLPRNRSFSPQPLRLQAGPAFFGAAPLFSGARVLGLHCNGSNGSTTFTDTEGKTVTPAGNAQISTAQSQFGGASALFDGSGDYLSVPSSTDFDFGTGAFTVKFWLRFISKTGFISVINRAYGADGGWLLQTGNGDGKLVFYTWSAGPTLNTIATDAGSTVNIDQWYHIALVRSGTTAYLFRDGTLVGSGSSTQNIAPAGTPPIYIGAGNGTGVPTGAYLNGYIDDLEVWKNGAHWTAGFTPPAAEFT
jgi:Concanavalin A-like lectin/glucanases superfamily